MIKSLSLNNLLTSNIDIEEYNPTYRKAIILHIMIFGTVAILITFALYHLFVKLDYFYASICFFSLSLAVYSFIDLRKTKEIKLASFITSVNTSFILLTVVVYQQAESFTLIWTIFFPIVAIFTNGSRRGLILTMIFYSIVFYLAYDGIGVWLDGEWNKAAFARLVFASSILSVIIYLFEVSLEKAFKILEKTREQEKEQLIRLKEVSITDSLTSLYNRRHLDVKFHENFKKADKNNDYFCFFILDLDHFKKYNDTFGHHKGDEALVSVAKVLKNNMRRKSDTAFRMGGEEFACLIMSDQESKVYALIEKIRTDIETIGETTASFGLCIIKNFDNENFDEMYKIADEFLYQAKERGRNQIVGEVVKLHKSII